MLDLIYCNGDSFVSGVELADPDILPEHPGFLDWPWKKLHEGGKEYEDKKSWILKTYDPTHPWSQIREDNSREILDLEYARAFPNKIKEKLNVKVINQAKGGASMDRIIRSSLSALLHLKEKYNNIVAIIGTTHPSRTEVPNCGYIEDDDRLCFDHISEKYSPWTCISPTYCFPNHKNEVSGLLAYKIKYELNYHMLINSYKNIILLQEFCSKNNIKLHWVATYNDINNLQVEFRYNDYEDIQRFKKYANLTYSVKMLDIADRIKINTLCPSGHFSEIVHEETANQLCEILKHEII